MTPKQKKEAEILEETSSIVSEFCINAKNSDIVDRVMKKIIAEDDQNSINEASFRYSQDWGVLANQIIGAEQF